MEIPDAQKIDGLKHLLSVVIDNTKRTHGGQSELAGKERNAARAVLRNLLGRAPSAEEVSALSV